jgi:large subunit ribosomal protein L9
VKLILTQEVSGLGTPGDVVEVKDGYGRNYLLPRKLATPWTRGGQTQVDAIRRARSSREHSSLDDAAAARDRLQDLVVFLRKRAGASGRLFGAVTPADIAEAIQQAGGPGVDRRVVALPRPVKSLGTHTVTVRLHPEVTASVDIEVIDTDTDTDALLAARREADAAEAAAAAERAAEAAARATALEAAAQADADDAAAAAGEAAEDDGTGDGTADGSSPEVRTGATANAR